MVAARIHHKIWQNDLGALVALALLPGIRCNAFSLTLRFLTCTRPPSGSDEQQITRGDHVACGWLPQTDYVRLLTRLILSSSEMTPYMSFICRKMVLFPLSPGPSSSSLIFSSSALLSYICFRFVSRAEGRKRRRQRKGGIARVTSCLPRGALHGLYAPGGSVAQLYMCVVIALHSGC